MKYLFNFKPSIFGLLVVLIIFSQPKIYCQSTYTEIGIASYYHDMFVGRKTATGEIFRQDKMTAAHKNLPLNSWVKVTNLKNDSVVILRINDRMPQSNKRSIDLTEAAAQKLDYLHAGLTKVKIEVIPDPTKNTVKKFILDKNQVLTKMEFKQVKELQLNRTHVNLKYPKLIYFNIPELTFKEKFYLLFPEKD